MSILNDYECVYEWMCDSSTLRNMKIECFMTVIIIYVFQILQKNLPKRLYKKVFEADMPYSGEKDIAETWETQMINCGISAFH